MLGFRMLGLENRAKSEIVGGEFLWTANKFI